MIQIATLLWQTFLAGAGTLCFAVLFCVPPKHYLACAIDGAVGWAVYYIAVALGTGNVIATLIATIPLTMLARVFAVMRKAPVTVFLLCGIFPLVPGAGIYYSAYYFIMGQNDLFVLKGFETFKIAVALALGISLVLGLPMHGQRRKLPR